jgi:hypothetical protein
MQDEKRSFTIFEDQDDYIEDVKDQFREATRRYTIYCKMFSHCKDWKMMRDELKRFLHYELEKTFHHTVIKETSDGVITMKFEENDQH